MEDIAKVLSAFCDACGRESCQWIHGYARDLIASASLITMHVACCSQAKIVGRPVGVRVGLVRRNRRRAPMVDIYSTADGYLNFDRDRRGA